MTAIIPAMQRNAIGVGTSARPLFRRRASRTIGAADPAWSDSILSLTAAALTSPTNTSAVGCGKRQDTRRPINSSKPHASNSPDCKRSGRAGGVAAPSPDPGQNAACHHENTTPAASACDTAAPPFSHRSMQSPDTGVPDDPGMAQDQVEHHCPIGTTAYSGQRCRPAGRCGHQGALGPDGVKAGVGAEAKATFLRWWRCWESPGVLGRVTGIRAGFDIRYTPEWGQVDGRRVAAAFLIRRVDGRP